MEEKKTAPPPVVAVLEVLVKAQPVMEKTPPLVTTDAMLSGAAEAVLILMKLQAATVTEAPTKPTRLNPGPTTLVKREAVRLKLCVSPVMGVGKCSTPRGAAMPVKLLPVTEEAPSALSTAPAAEAASLKAQALTARLRPAPSCAAPAPGSSSAPTQLPAQRSAEKAQALRARLVFVGLEEGGQRGGAQKTPSRPLARTPMRAAAKASEVTPLAFTSCMAAGAVREKLLTASASKSPATVRNAAGGGPRGEGVRLQLASVSLRAPMPAAIKGSG